MLTVERIQDMHRGSLRTAARKRRQDEADLSPAPHPVARWDVDTHAAGTFAGCFSIIGSLADTSLRIRAAWASSVNPRAVS